ncbi:MAG: hypothetical protein LBG19_00785 [Prevotellaceae bacterium]|jgi:hypothetical protein|nr:hypothetical protein [Prevotellaceae bacterium]
MKRSVQIIISAILAGLLLWSCKDDKEAEPLGVETGAVKNVSFAEATCDGIAAGEVSTKGICWSTNINPTVSDSKVEAGGGEGKFTASLTGLTENTKYYVRAYVTDGKQTLYGEIKEFTTYKQGEATIAIITSQPYPDKIELKVRALTDGGNAITERGICYALTTEPTTADNVIKSSSPGLGAFDVTISGLAQETDYYIRPYAINSAGIFYGQEVVLTTPRPTPKVITVGHDFLGYGSIMKGELVSIGGLDDVVLEESGIVYSENPDPAIDGASVIKLVRDSKLEAEYEFKVRLTPGVTYYYKAFATNQYGTSYGEEKSFTVRELFNEVIIPGAAGETAPYFNGLNLTATTPPSSQPGVASDFQTAHWTAVNEALLETNAAGRTLEGFRFYFNKDTNQDLIAVFVIYYKSGTSNYQAQFNFKLSVNANGELEFSDLAAKTGNAATIWNALNSKPTEQVKIQAMFDYLTSGPFVLDYISDTSDNTFILYPAINPDSYFRMGLLRVTGLTDVTPW